MRTRRDQESKSMDSSSRRSFGKKVLASCFAFGLAPLTLPNVARASGQPEIVKAPVNKLQALIQEQLHTYLSDPKTDGNALETALSDEGFHSVLGLRLM